FDSEIKVSSGRESCHTHKPNRLANFDVLTPMHKYLRQVQIHRLVSIRVHHVHHISIAALAAGKQHLPAPNCLHGSAYRRTIIRTQMGAIHLQYGMETRLAEMRRYRRPKLQRRLQKRFLERFTLGSVVCRMPAWIME